MKSNFIFAGLFSFFLISCGKNELEKHMSEFNECAEKKKSEKGYKYANIQEALNAYDFEVARDYLACHPDKDSYYNNGKKAGTFGSPDKSPYAEDLRQIVTAEVTYFVAHGEFKKAETTAKEADLIDLYNKIANEGFEEKLDEKIQQKDFLNIYNFVSNSRSSYQKIKYDLNGYLSFESNEEYNNKIREFNALLDKILVKYKYAKIEKSEILSIIDLALPELVLKNENRSSDGLKLSDLFKKEATAKYLK